MSMDASRIIRFNELKTLIGGVNRDTIKRWEQAGDFPKRIKLGGRAMGWLMKDVQEWIDKKRN